MAEDSAVHVMECVGARSQARLDQAEARTAELETEIERQQAEIESFVAEALARFLENPPG